MNAYQAALSSACILVTLNYIALKLRIRVETYEQAAVPIFTGLASIVMMLQPSAGHALNFSFVPILMAGLRFGFGSSLLSTIIPIFYLLLMKPDHFIIAIVQNLIVPAVVSALFHKIEYRTGYTFLRIRDGLIISLVLAVLCLQTDYVVNRPDLYGSDWLPTNAFMLLITAGAVLVLIAMFNDDSKTWLAHRQLEMLANQDGLTKLPNLRSFLDIAQNTLSNQPIAILMIDIDNFKQYNDRNGHLMGDNLLREIGSMLRNLIRDQDYVARYGGEEFIAMCLSSEPQQLMQIAHRLCTTIASHPFAGQDHPDASKISVSIGISICGQANDNLQKVISQADEALYESKRNGKNRYTFYSEIPLSENQTAAGAS